MNSHSTAAPQGTTAGQGNTAERPRKYIVASLIGNSLEWYDFFLYATASAVVFGTLFFPEGTDPLVGTLGAFAGFAVGFAARPIGGIIFGHIGDKVSRKTSLVLTLIVMGLATTAMGLLPTYAQIGIWAPAMLIVLRILQGIAAGGEWGGAVLLISENTETKRRGLLSAFSQGGISLGFVLSALVFYLVQLMPHEQFMAWGWRIPFLLSIVLLGVGIWIRTHLPEHHKPADESTKKHNVPAIDAIRNHPKEILVAMGLRFAENGGSYIFLSFSVVYGVHVGVDQGWLLLSVAISMAVSFFTYLFFGHLSDKFGRRRIYAAGTIMMALMAFPFFWMIDSHSHPLILVAFMIANGICHGAMVGTQPSFFHELFPAHIRYSGMSIAHEMAAIFAGGLAPMIATALLINFDSSVPVSIYLLIMVAITLVAIIASRSLKTGTPEQENVDGTENAGAAAMSVKIDTEQPVVEYTKDHS